MRAARTGVGTVLLAAVMGASVLTVANAYFRGGGAGLGIASTATLSPLTVAPAALTDPLYPGRTADLAVTVTNPNNADLVVESLALDTTQGTNGFSRASGSASCTLSSFSFTTQTNDGDGWVVSGGGSAVITMPDAVAAALTTPSACQGAVLTVFLRTA